MFKELETLKVENASLREANSIDISNTMPLLVRIKELEAEWDSDVIALKSIIRELEEQLKLATTLLSRFDQRLNWNNNARRPRQSADEALRQLRKDYRLFLAPKEAAPRCCCGPEEPCSMCGRQDD